MLLSNSLITPEVGTVFWTTLIFLIFFLVLRKFGWKPILSMIKQREEMIKGSLESAEQARKEMLKLQSDNEAIIRKARDEREDILREAREIRDKLIAEARGKANEEAEKLVEKAKTSIGKEKTKALSEIREHIANLSVEIASRLLGEELKRTGAQEKLIDDYLEEVKITGN
ncbi:MAG: F0F1 ATP synthase subunit B [Bacteroidales bacterium]|nr:F0F1 ATP synthase subunit B [Bacteroidales bacterium]